MQPTYNKFLNALFMQDTASLEPSEVEVKSISFIISETHFLHCFLFLFGILHLFYTFLKAFLQKLFLLFSIILKTKLLFSSKIKLIIRSYFRFWHDLQNLIHMKKFSYAVLHVTYTFKSYRNCNHYAI